MTAAGPRYAPADPTLPKPWRAIIDGNTNFIYFWNPKTNVTQYERPADTIVSSNTAQLQQPPPSSSDPDEKETKEGDACPQTMDSPKQPQPADQECINKDEKSIDLENMAMSSSQQQPTSKAEDIVVNGEPSPSNPSCNTTASSIQSEQQPFEENKTREESNEQKNNLTSSSSSSTGPCYAPEDPTLPKPWIALIDATTGYMYFWNPMTQVTQYQRPVVEPSSSMPQLQQQPTNEHAPKDEVTFQYNGMQRYQSQNGQGGLAKFSQESPLQGGNIRNQQPSVQVDLSVEAYRRQHEITVIGNDVSDPYMTFESTGFPFEILKEVHRVGFSIPSPIQAQSWPITLKGRDIVAVAKTGSGKTLGYLIPGFILLKRLHNDSKLGPTVLVLSPTRELATQIQDEAVKFGGSSKISCTCLYGGAPKGPQLRELNHGADIVVATPGRLNDILEMNRLSLRQVSYLVLDEADRMLDMGFEPQLQKIVKQLPSKRQTLMFTATWPKEVRRIASQFLDKPIQVNIGNINELVANKSITQHVEVITYMEKRRRLEQILRSQESGSKIIIFCSTKKMCDQLSRNLTRQFGAAAIHGDKSQSERDFVLSQFRSGKSPILVATDVAARGLDIKDVRAVINYDFPTGVEDYVHRIGRTGRAGATGEAYTFFCEQDSKYASDLVKILKGANQKIPSELQSMASRGGYGSQPRRWSSGTSTSEWGSSRGGGMYSKAGNNNYDPVAKHDTWDNNRGRNLNRDCNHEQRQRSRS